MIIDCHGHYTTEPQKLHDFRKHQVAAIKDPAQKPSRAGAKNQRRRIARERRGRAAEIPARARHQSDDLLAAGVRHVASYRRRGREPRMVAGVERADLPPHHALSRTISSACASCRSRPASIRRTASASWSAASTNSASSAATSIPTRRAGAGTRPPIGDRLWYPFYEKMVELDVPAMIHVSASLQSRTVHTTGAHYINGDTTAFMQLITSDLFRDFPTLKFIIPHGGGAVPYHWGRYRGLAQDMKRPPLEGSLLQQRVLRHLRLPSAGHRTADQGDPGRQHPVRLAKWSAR